MSTNVIITPAVAAAGGTAILPFLTAGAAVAGVAMFLAATDEEWSALRTGSREGLRDKRLASIQLRTNDLDRLVRSASQEHFHMTPLAAGAVRLANGSNDRVWMVQKPDGIHLIGHDDALRRVVTANTKLRTIEHFQKRGYETIALPQRSGGVFIRATGRGAERVDVTVGPNGEAKVDPQNFPGRECETVVRDLAAALDGSIVNFTPKPEYFSSAPLKLCGLKRG